MPDYYCWKRLIIKQWVATNPTRGMEKGQDLSRPRLFDRPGKWSNFKNNISDSHLLIVAFAQQKANSLMYYVYKNIYIFFFLAFKLVSIWWYRCCIALKYYSLKKRPICEKILLWYIFEDPFESAKEPKYLREKYE